MFYVTSCFFRIEHPQGFCRTASNQTPSPLLSRNLAAKFVKDFGWLEKVVEEINEVVNYFL